MAFSATALTSAGLPAKKEKKEWGLFEKLMELNASHSEEGPGLISILRTSSGLEIIIGADKVQRCQCQLLSGMHFKKQFKKPSDVGIISRDQIRSKWEKFIWHFGALKELRLYKLYSVCVCGCMCVHACVCALMCAKKSKCACSVWGEDMQSLRIMGKSFNKNHRFYCRLMGSCPFFFFFSCQSNCTRMHQGFI